MGFKLIHLVKEVPGEMVTEALSANFFVTDIISQIISIMFIFDTCHCSSAVVKSVHYEHDIQRLTLIILKNWKITEQKKMA